MDAPTRPLTQPSLLRGASALRLTVVSGPDRGHQVVVRTAQARIGSGARNALVLHDASVSRVHCELGLSENALTLRDLGSTNGTWVGPVSVESARIAPGTHITIGQSVVYIEASDEPSTVMVSSARSFGELIGESAAMRMLYALLERVAPTDVTVLIQGETGTGKEVVARSIHAGSKRSAGPFVTFDCSAVPEGLFESELFGHTKGAFTGAHAARKGVFEEAQGGTLFLDEIGELPLPQQAKLLRALETRTIRAVGASHETKVDVRILAASHRALATQVNQGAFREDLYYRLAVVEAQVPALRARPDDIPLLVRHFLRRLGLPEDTLGHDLEHRLHTRSWPGNVRELRNFVERSISLGFAPQLHGESFKQSPLVNARNGVPVHLPLREAREAWTATFEIAYVRAMLAETDGNVTRAAERAGVSRRFFQRLRAKIDDNDSD